MAGFTSRTNKIMAMIKTLNAETATQNNGEQNQYYLPKNNNCNLIALPIFTEDDVLLGSGKQSQLIYCENNYSNNFEVESTSAYNIANNESELVHNIIIQTDYDLQAWQKSRLNNVPERCIDSESNIDLRELLSDTIQTGCDIIPW